MKALLPSILLKLESNAGTRCTADRSMRSLGINSNPVDRTDTEAAF
jgi:hypothetical protein